MDFDKLVIGFAVTGSFCTLERAIPQIQNLVKKGAKVIPIMSENTCRMDTRFGKAKDFKDQLEAITGHKVIDNINAAEPIGPKKMLDSLVIAPCTGNTTIV